MEDTIEFLIKDSTNRKALVIAFANAGYWVRIEERDIFENSHEQEYWVVVQPGEQD